MPAVSVIMPVFQAGKTLRRAVESVLRQSFRDFELLLSDDGSTDQSVEIEEEFVRKDERIRILRSLHGGSAAARNAAVLEAKGEYGTRCTSIQAKATGSVRPAERAFFFPESMRRTWPRP